MNATGSSLSRTSTSLVRWGVRTEKESELRRMQRERDIQKSRGGGCGTAVIAIVADVIGEAHGSPVILPDAFHCAGGVDLSCT